MYPRINFYISQSGPKAGTHVSITFGVSTTFGVLEWYMDGKSVGNSLGLPNVGHLGHSGILPVIFGHFWVR